MDAVLAQSYECSSFVVTHAPHLAPVANNSTPERLTRSPRMPLSPINRAPEVRALSAAERFVVV